MSRAATSPTFCAQHIHITFVFFIDTFISSDFFVFINSSRFTIFETHTTTTHNTTYLHLPSTTYHHKNVHTSIFTTHHLSQQKRIRSHGSSSPHSGRRSHCQSDCPSCSRFDMAKAKASPQPYIVHKCAPVWIFSDSHRESKDKIQVPFATKSHHGHFFQILGPHAVTTIRIQTEYSK